MIRVVFEGMIFFMVPFVLFAGFILIRGGNPFDPATWPRPHLIALAVAGIALALLGVVLTGLELRGGKGAYRPAEYRDGQLVPGRIE